MRKLLILLCALLIVVFLIFLAIVSSFNVSRDYERTYTSAVCSGNICKDYEFKCLNGNVVSSRAISGFVTFGDDWVDLRDEKDKDRC